MRPARNPIVAGVALALAAAAAFGATTPLVKRFGDGLGAFTTAMLLYAGAAAYASVAAMRRVPAERFRIRHAWLIAGVAAFGAFLAPVLLAWGLRRASGTAASLMLNLEAVFTVLLGMLLNREAIARRVWIAVLLIASGGALIVLDRQQRSAAEAIGLIAIAGATLSWAMDNTLSRHLADLHPDRVVLAKAALGLSVSAIAARAVHEPAPSVQQAAGLLACGVVGYGVSLRLYLLAQRRLGSARTGSVFATAPFLGAIVAFALGDGFGGPLSIAALPLMAVGVYLHLTERHEHEHAHEAAEHTHEHAHDDGHHDHVHEPPFLGRHSHAHAHRRLVHTHPHGEDEHHRHH